MFVCGRCLQAIESHEGSQWKRQVNFWDIPEELIHEEHEVETITCEWCNEETEDNIWEI